MKLFLLLIAIGCILFAVSLFVEFRESKPAKHRHPDNVRKKRGATVTHKDSLEMTLDAYVETLQKKE